MTLQRHRSNLLPEVEYGIDGTVFVTDIEGTFPMRGKERNRMTPKDYDSYRSYDRNRNELHPKTGKKRYSRRFGDEVGNLPDTISTSHSLGRRLRRSRSGDGRYGTVNSSGTAERRIRGGTPKMPQDYAASLTLRRYKKSRSLDDRLSTTSDSKIHQTKSKRSKKAGDRTFAPLTWNEKKLLSLSSPDAKKALISMPLRRHLAVDRLPALVFIINGILLALFGVASLLLSWWHLYLCELWTGALVLFLGVLGAVHRGDYLSKSKNAFYIIVGALSSAAVLVSSGLVLKVLIPLLKGLAMGREPHFYINTITFTNMNHSLVGIALAEDAMVYTSIALHLGSLLLLLINYFTWSATVMAIGNHWDYVYTITAVCDHRGRPRLFNPLAQMSVGQATVLVGIVCVYLSTADVNMHLAPAWAGGMVIIAGLFAMFHGKRVDLHSMGVLGTLAQLLALCACGVALAFVAMAMVDDVNAIYPDRSKLTDDAYNSRLASLASEALYLTMIVINLVFSAGVLFRLARTTLCAHCYGKSFT